MSSSESEQITDTVVLLYFLLVDQFELLEHLIGSPVRVPFAVYDPAELVDEPARSDLQSEIRQAVRHYEALARSETSAVARASAEDLRTRVESTDDLYRAGRLVPVTMTVAEVDLSDRLQSRTHIASFGERVPVGPGEAACVAIAHHRSWTIVSDDQAALRLMDHLSSDGYTYERIRRLLLRAVGDGVLTPADAVRIHGEMRGHGFWDTELVI